MAHATIKKKSSVRIQSNRSFQLQQNADASVTHYVLRHYRTKKQPKRQGYFNIFTRQQQQQQKCTLSQESTSCRIVRPCSQHLRLSSPVWVPRQWHRLHWCEASNSTPSYGLSGCGSLPEDRSLESCNGVPAKYVFHITAQRSCWKQVPVIVGCIRQQQYAECIPGTDQLWPFTHYHTRQQSQIKACCPVQSQHTDTGQSSPVTDPVKPAVWQGNRHCTSFWWHSAVEADAVTVGPIDSVSVK